MDRQWIKNEKQLENKTGNGFWTALLLNMAYFLNIKDLN